MDLTIEKAIHLGLCAHENGDGQGAALFERSVLNTKSDNAEANRNLGFLAVAPTFSVPPKARSDSGNPHVAIGMQSDAGEMFANEDETIDVRTGSLVLLPASVMHLTTSFQSKQDRVVLAFDMEPD